MVRRGQWGRDSGSDLTNVQYKLICNCHNESLQYNEYTIIKINEKIIGSDNDVCRKKTPLLAVGGNINCIPHLKNSMDISQKVQRQTYLLIHYSHSCPYT
jgi:hypothetical protein